MVANSDATSTQKSNAQVTQNYYGSCSYNCTNDISNVVIDLTSTILDGGITINQACKADINCTMDANLDAATSTLFKADNTATSESGNNFWTGYIGNFNDSNASSYQDLNAYITQGVTQKCEVNVANNIHDVSIIGNGTHIEKDIIITQGGTAQGTCVLTAAMTGNAQITGYANNSASSTKKGDKNIMGTVLFLALGFLLLSGLVLGGYSIYKGTQKGKVAGAAGAASGGLSGGGIMRMV